MLAACVFSSTICRNMAVIFRFNYSLVFCMLFLMLLYHYFLPICEEEEVFFREKKAIFV